MKNAKRVALLVIVLAAALALAGCGKKTMKIANVNEAANTFDFVDGSGNKISYDRLVVNGKEVLDWQCMSMAMNQTVVFATEEGQIVREGNRTTYGGQAYTTNAKLVYELKDGTLTILDVK